MGVRGPRHGPTSAPSDPPLVHRTVKGYGKAKKGQKLACRGEPPHSNSEEKTQCGDFEKVKKELCAPKGMLKLLQSRSRAGGRRGGAFLITTGSYVLSSGNRAGNSEEITEESVSLLQSRSRAAGRRGGDGSHTPWPHHPPSSGNRSGNSEELIDESE
jgi:hypothetical protein